MAANRRHRSCLAHQWRRRESNYAENLIGQRNTF